MGDRLHTFLLAAAISMAALDEEVASIAFLIAALVNLVMVYVAARTDV